jgi:AcrR family transcriptional regulator
VSQTTEPASIVDDEVSGDSGLSPKARRTRARLVEAATEVFSQQQYLATNVADIVARAGVSHGTFYTYFDSKEDVFREVGLEMQSRFLAVRDEVPGRDEATLLERVEATNRSYLRVYQENAALFAVIEQGATFNDELRKIRLEIRKGFVDRSERAIARFQREGIVYDDLDARYLAKRAGFDGRPLRVRMARARRGVRTRRSGPHPHAAVGAVARHRRSSRHAAAQAQVPQAQLNVGSPSGDPLLRPRAARSLRLRPAASSSVRLILTSTSSCCGTVASTPPLHDGGTPWQSTSHSSRFSPSSVTTSC